MDALPRDLLPILRDATGAQAIARSEPVQTLWSGYGQILRLTLEGGDHEQVIVKHVAPPAVVSHPRGWGGDRGHQRKLRSYEVEHAFYRHHAPCCDPRCRVPALLASRGGDGRWLLVMEDLDAAGLSARRSLLADAELDACLAWLAHFHARFLGREPAGLWETGTYWHLATRPEELAAIADPELRAAAPALDARLRACTHQTLVHGDAKVANFCFREDAGEPRVAAVDFQYVGGGCGMKDVAYFLGSCLDEGECERRADALLDRYFALLRAALPYAIGAAVEAEWRPLYPHAWADFHRFLAGWAPTHHKIHRYTERLTELALRDL